ncbi:MAG: hypothetical protein EOP48_04310 [Sphingobacteriales bacterium]|nr:MAG: hypothetical protein EOP48_04310 [Sphingobacteriales bacterium]
MDALPALSVVTSEILKTSCLQTKIVQAMGPIEHQMRSSLAKLKGCEYPDNFDWNVYDKIASSLPEVPRGGVVFNTTFKLANHHSSCTKCHHSFEIDSYGRGCYHDCGYCYAKEQLTTHGYWNRPQPFPVNLAEVRKIFYTVFETDKPSKWRKVMKQRIPVRMGSMSDSFMWLDLRYGVTKELLKIFKYYRYPYIVFTRSDLVAHDSYLSLLDKNLCSVQFSISGNNSAFIRKIEPGAPSYKRRLNALKKLSENDFWTTVRVNPLFPRYPDGYFTDPDSIKKRFGSRSNVPELPFFDDQFIAELADAGVPSVLAGFVRLSSPAVKNLSSTTDINFQSFFKPELWENKGHKRYSDPEISYYYQSIKSQCLQNNVRFGTCYIGNGLKDYYQYQNLWDNKKDCCDAVGNVKEITNTSQSIAWEERIRHAPVKALALTAMDAENEADLQAKLSSRKVLSVNHDVDLK